MDTEQERQDERRDYERQVTQDDPRPPVSALNRDLSQGPLLRLPQERRAQERTAATAEGTATSGGGTATVAGTTTTAGAGLERDLSQGPILRKKQLQFDFRINTPDMRGSLRDGVSPRSMPRGGPPRGAGPSAGPAAARGGPADRRWGPTPVELPQDLSIKPQEFIQARTFTSESERTAGGVQLPSRDALVSREAPASPPTPAPPRDDWQSPPQPTLSPRTISVRQTTLLKSPADNNLEAPRAPRLSHFELGPNTVQRFASAPVTKPPEVTGRAGPPIEHEDDGKNLHLQNIHVKTEEPDFWPKLVSIKTKMEQRAHPIQPYSFRGDVAHVHQQSPAGTHHRAVGEHHHHHSKSPGRVHHAAVEHIDIISHVETVSRERFFHALRCGPFMTPGTR